MGKIIRRPEKSDFSIYRRRTEIMRILRNQPNNYITKGELARRLGVPERNIQRDIAELLADYEPIEIRECRGGGYRYYGGKYARFLSDGHVELLEKYMQIAKTANEVQDAMMLQGLIDALG